jgi:uncharacterized SAM-binding protein YcdF (DUF218 family)
MPRHVRDSWSSYLGPGAATSFGIALSTAVVGVGLPVAYRLWQVIGAARRDGRRNADCILVLGRALRHDQPTAVFRARLERAARLYREGLAPRVIVAGGLTGDATRTEAEAGREVLVAAGVPSAAILLEDQSRHTLENLFHARQTLRELRLRTVLLVSDRLHIARAEAYARGFGLDVTSSPAPYPSRLPLVGPALRALRESFFVHWYHCGVLYSRAVGSRRLLERVT